MATIRCGKCFAELILPETSSFITGTTVSKESKGDYILPMRDSKGRFTKKTTEYCETEINNNSNTKENETMMNANNNGANNNINGGMNMNGFDMNNFDMNALATLVAQKLAQSVNTPVTEKVDNNISNVTVEKECYKTVEDGGRWAKDSKWYGKEICGFIFNPYMIRWHLQKEFERIMNDYNYNVHAGITKEYPYMYSVNFTVKEISTLAFLERNDRIAFDERKNCFTLNQCKRIMTQYYKDVISVLEREERELVRNNRVGKEVYIYIKKIGKVNVGIVSERINEHHKVEKYMARHLEFEALILSFNKKIERINVPYGVWNYKALYELIKDEHFIKVPANTQKSRDFMDCFIRSGAYYTLKQTLMFKEGTVLEGTRSSGLTGRDAVLELMRELKYGREGYIIYKYLKLTKGIRY